ncbi:MAG: SdiA-regulated domain-containing protein [Ignavibacteriales bacterium]
MKRRLLISLVVFIIFSGCKQEKKEDSDKILSFSIAEEIPVPESSGLDLSYDETTFWVVSDENSTVYLIDSWGREVKNFKVDGNDLEDITVIDENKLAVVLERTREVVILNTSGVELKRVKLNLEGDSNSGLEGITYDPEAKRFYILNEKKPKMLLTTDENLNEIRRDTLNFSKDVSGIYFDVTEKILWILSDESQQIFKTDLLGKPFDEFKIKISRPEGITLNKNRTKLYVVSDNTNSLYIFNLE